LILLDYDLGRETGVEIMGRIRAANVDTPIVFLTGKNRPEEHQRFLDAGAAGVLNKPFDPMSIADDTLPFLKK